MKKFSKSLMLIGVTTLTIGIGAALQSTNKINKDILNLKAKAYNHNAESALENIFVQDNMLILPFIFESVGPDPSKPLISMPQLENEFRKAGLTISNISTSNIGTGTQVTVVENSNIYNILIYGDVNGDGKINLIDVQRVLTHHLDSSTRALTGIYAIAANVSNTNEEINLIDVQRLLVFYSGGRKDLVYKEPTSLIEKDFVVSVTITNPAKTVYVQGDELDLAGGKLNLKYYSGNIKSVDIDESMISGYEKDKLGEQTITVSYKTNDTYNGAEMLFTNNFQVSVKKPLSNLNVSIATKSGNCYQQLKIASITSGQDEADVDINKLAFVIKKIKDENGKAIQSQYQDIDASDTITKVTKKSLNDGNGTIEISFVAKDAGTYRITPNVGTIIGRAMEVEIKEDTTVTDIEIENINNTTFNQSVEKSLNIIFKHKYTDTDIRTVIIDKSKVYVSTSSTSIDVTFRNKNGVDLSGNQSGIDTVIKSISLTPQKAGNNSFTITVGSYKSAPITINVKPLSLRINGGNPNITLAKNATPGNYNYTKVEIYKVENNENGQEVRSYFSVRDIVQLQSSTGIISFKDSGRIQAEKDGQQDINYIDIKPYDSNGNEILSSTQGYYDKEVHYIGIALQFFTFLDTSGYADKLLNDGYIQVYYNDIPVLKLYVTVSQ